MRGRLLNLFALSFLAIGCKTMQPASFETTQPRFIPEQFFEGHTTSSGVFENRRGHATQHITTSTRGTVKNGALYIEQDLNPEKSKALHRSWVLRRVGAHQVDATANDIIGVAHGEVYGNMMCWKFTLDRVPGHPLQRVQLYQAMYLQTDGKTLIIRTIVRKFGVVVAQVTEQFRREL
jgi:hypothetical protein